MFTLGCRMSARWLSWSGESCTTTTNASPVSPGTFAKKLLSAASPPAEAPIPTTVTGSLKDLGSDESAPGLRGGDKTQPSSGVVLFILLLAIPLTSAEFSSVLWIGPAASRSTIFCDS
jgi:hypothetical protein